MNMVRKEEQSQVVPMGEAAAVLSIVARAAADPNVDIDKLERLMLMQERALARQARQEFAADMAEMQPKLPVIGERGKVEGRYGYALWEDINAAIKPVLQAHGFALTFRMNTSGGITVTGVLSHKGGHTEETTITLTADKSGGKPDVQAVASSVSYGKRYTAGALLNLTSHGEDDDAFTATTGFDASEWLDAITSATDRVGLDRIAAELKGATSIPPPALKRIRAAWAARAKVVK